MKQPSFCNNLFDWIGYLVGRGYIRRIQISNYLKLYDDCIEAIDITFWYERWNEHKYKAKYRKTLNRGNLKFFDDYSQRSLENGVPMDNPIFHRKASESPGIEDLPKKTKTFELVFQKQPKNMELYNKS